MRAFRDPLASKNGNGGSKELSRSWTASDNSILSFSIIYVICDFGYLLYECI